MLKEIISVTLILFAVIDALGSIPIFADIQHKVGRIRSLQATFISGVLMIAFLFVGESLLQLIGIDLASFSLAGGIVIFIIALELILGIHIFKSSDISTAGVSVVPIAFPLIAGAGTLTTLLSLKSEYSMESIVIAIVVNLIFVYIVLKSIPLLTRLMGPGGLDVLRRIFGVILLALAVKLIKTNMFI